MRRLAVAVVTLVALLAAAGPADAAISRAQSIKIMKRAVRGDFVKVEQKVYGRRRPLPRGAVVTQGGIPSKRLSRAKKTDEGLSAKVPAIELKRPTWFYWHDQNPQAGFQKAGQIILVDAVNGRVRKMAISWWPVINRKRVFPPGIRAPRAVAATPPAAWSASVVPGLRNDCIVTIGDRTDPYFVNGLARITRMASSIGARMRPARSVNEIGSTIDAMAREDPPCTDVMIYVAGHGWGPPGTDVTTQDGQPVATSPNARITVKSTVGGGASPVVREENLDLADLRKIVKDRPTLTFKLIIESCFAGRWTAIMTEPNVRITLTSAAANEVTFLAITHAQAGTQSKGQINFDPNAPVGTPDGPTTAPPFTEWFAGKVEEWSDKPEETSKGADLGEAAGYAGAHKQGNRAEDLGWQHGQTDDRTSTRPHAPPPGTGPPPPAQTGYTVRVVGTYRHIGPGVSEVCWDITTDPPRADARVTVKTTGPGVTVGGDNAGRTDANGAVRIRAGIDELGEYRSDVKVVDTAGIERTAQGSVTVLSQQGTCPPP
jgi:hypothetical protein